MNLVSGFNIKKEIYNRELNLIEGIKFTYREIDIIACILHNRGEKKIASLLLISPRTVNTHIHNIMLKLGHNSREYVIDFVEKSGKIQIVRQYYLQLLIHSSFKNQLIKIGKINKEIGVTCGISYQQISVEEKEILDQLKESLNLANIILTVSKNKEEIKSSLCVLTYRSIHNSTKDTPIIIILKKNNNFIYDESTYLDFSDPEQYYFVIFKLLKKIINKNSVEELIQEFNKEYQAINNSFQTKTPETEKLIGYSFSKNKLIKKNLIIVVSFILVISWIIASQFLIENKTINLDQIIIDLPLPHKKTLLTRQSIFSEMEEKLTNNNGIRTVALVGAGGSGKTTIARRYARDQKTALIWEINCETSDSIISSFKQLAHSLCKTEKENQQLTTILQIKNDQEMEKKLFIFLTKKIKFYPNWIIIYNNVKTFNDIQQYFPYDQNVWGNGRVIITTTDHNIVNNHYILAENIIHVGILNKEEKLELFNKIICDDKNYNNDQQSMIIKFLEKIPPFPLDVSLAASYIKEIKSSYTEYLQYITEPNEGFITVQKSILNDISEYKKTRYDIVALSVKHVIESHPDFVDLLLLICLINSEDIPKDLLIKYKDNIIVNQFIHESKKFSLIAEKLLVNSNNNLTLSINRNTQEIALAYLSKELKLAQNTKQILDISNILVNFITEELKVTNSKNIPLLVPHIETYLINNKWLNEEIISSLYVKLGIYYFHVANYQKAQELFKNALIINKKYHGIEHVKTSETLGRLGGVYRNMGRYEESITLHELALKNLKKHYGNEHIKSVLISTYLGSSYRHVGRYMEAKNLLEYALEIYKKKYPTEHIKIARTSGYLGNVYHDMGEYRKAKELLEQTYNIYIDYYGKDNIQTAWISVRLANVYRSIGECGKAKKLVEQALIIYKNFGENCIEIAWSLLHLGNILIELKNYEEAQKFLEEALITYIKFYGKHHLETARILNSLGAIYYQIDSTETAEIFTNRALTIFQQNKHPESFVSLQRLSDIYFKKSIQENNKGNMIQSQLFKQKASSYLKEAKAVVIVYFPANSPHISSIQDREKELEN